MSEWISVKERLPKESGRYLVFQVKASHMHNCAAMNYPLPCCEPNIAYYNHYCNGWEWYSGTHQICDPTHWIPLPKPPEEK